MGGHKKANIKSKSKKQTAGDIKKIKKVGKKRRFNKERDKVPFYTQPVSPKQVLPIDKLSEDEVKFLYLMRKQWIFGKDNSQSLKYFCQIRQIPDQNMEPFYKTLKSKLSRLTYFWLEEEHGFISGDVKIWLKIDCKDEIIEFLNLETERL